MAETSCTDGRDHVITGFSSRRWLFGAVAGRWAEFGPWGFLQRPEWAQLRAGARPPLIPSAEPGEWQHGWQYHASSPLEHHFRETMILAQSCAADQAHLRSHAGPCASDVVCGAPTQKEFEVEPHLFRTLVLERLRLPLDVTDAVWECGCRLDTEGKHQAACARSGRLRTRAVGPERTVARICREAGALVRCNTKLRDMNVAVPAADERAIEVLASGLPLFQGAQLAVDVTVRSALTAHGLPRSASTTNSWLANAAAWWSLASKPEAEWRGCQLRE